MIYHFMFCQREKNQPWYRIFPFMVTEMETETDPAVELKIRRPRCEDLARITPRSFKKYPAIGSKNNLDLRTVISFNFDNSFLFHTAF